jgi:hypothetical protein
LIARDAVDRETPARSATLSSVGAAVLPGFGVWLGSGFGSGLGIGSGSGLGVGFGVGRAACMPSVVIASPIPVCSS